MLKDHSYSSDDNFGHLPVKSTSPTDLRQKGSVRNTEVNKGLSKLTGTSSPALRQSTSKKLLTQTFDKSRGDSPTNGDDYQLRKVGRNTATAKPKEVREMKEVREVREPKDKPIGVRKLSTDSAFFLDLTAPRT